jgi:hypothetical protein
MIKRFCIVVGGEATYNNTKFSHIHIKPELTLNKIKKSLHLNRFHARICTVEGGCDSGFTAKSGRSPLFLYIEH